MTATEDAPGPVAGYRIERVLGRGGMGTVYLAANLNLPRYEALKVLNAEGAQDPSFRARFLREAAVAGALEHPNIVAVYNRGETTTGDPWIAMQYVEGPDANSATIADPMSLERTVFVIGEIAEALDYVHSRGLVHRDVKPANILLADNGRVLLADFGIARALDDLNSITAMGNIVMTVAYAAPELLAGHPVDGRSDVYALGCTLFRLLTGKTPYESYGTLPAIANAHMSAPPPRASDLAALPPSIDFVIAKALAKRPEDRFQSAGELAHALRRVLDEPATQLRTSFVDAQSTQMRPVPMEQGFQATQLRSSTPTQSRLVPAAPPHAGSRRTLLIAGAVALVVVSVAVAVIMWPRNRAATPNAGPGATAAGAPTTTGPPPVPSLADQPFSTFDTFLPTAAEFPEGYELNTRYTPEPAGDLPPDVFARTRNNRIDKTPTNCNTIEPSEMGWKRGKRPAKTDIWKTYAKHLSISMQIAPLYSEPGNAADTLVGCEQTARGWEIGMVWECRATFGKLPSATLAQDAAIANETCDITWTSTSEKSTAENLVYCAAIRGLLVYVFMERYPTINPPYDRSAMNQVFTTILKKIADYKIS